MDRLVDFIFHIDQHLIDLIAQYGVWAHGFIFLIIFLETGLVIFPFLPGDSLLFAAGLLAQPGKGFNFPLLMIALPWASIVGDSVNFHLGKWFGKKFLFKWKAFKPEWLDKTRAFYEKHGAKTIILGRFAPIVRTVAPFVAGMDAMPFKKYFPLCVIGSYIWVWICCGAGYLLGNIPWVHQNFEITILAVIGLSLVSFVVEYGRSKWKDAKAKSKASKSATEEV
ncbi:VTT domain-containing protein [Kamptonema cortianum]|nr:VTT domain-containing protein [Geitlerinema splendidum]MDK3156833.1 VTT domain-containing protein [Kamptonema cortianum]